MKTLYIVFLPLFLCVATILTSFAQGWQQTFGEQTTRTNKILELENGTLIVAGTDKIADSPSHIFIKKISVNGAFLDQNNIEENCPITLNDFITTDDAGLLGVGVYQDCETNRRYIYCFKTDLDGAVLWQKVYDSLEYSKAYTVIQLADGNYLLAGSTQSSAPEPLSFSTFMMKVDSNGEVLFTKIYEQAGFDTSGDVLLETSNQEILMGGYYGYPLASPGDTFLGRYDAEGNEIWYGNSHIPTVMEKIIELENNTFLIGGSSYGGESSFSLKVVDEFGNTIWFNSYSIFSPYINDMGSVVQAADSGFVMSGVSGGFSWPNDSIPVNFYDAVVIKTDALGNRLSTATFGGDSYDNLTDIITTQDGGFAMSGQSASFGEGARQTYVVKTNSECLISSTNTIYPTIPVLKISPNPTSNRASIQLEDIDIKDGQFQLFDSTGKKIRETKFSSSSFIFKKKNLTNGLYFFQILEKGKVIGNGKLLLN